MKPDQRRKRFNSSYNASVRKHALRHNAVTQAKNPGNVPMDNEALKRLCLNLLRADTEDDVIKILKDHDLWDKPDQWRFLGDTENNYSTVGNQGSRSDAAIVEKIINSVDARLLNECRGAGSDPERKDAPESIREAVARYFDSANAGTKSTSAGIIAEWSNKKRLEIALGITLVATGHGVREGSPSFTISDCGEGQTPKAMPDTLLSLNRSNKLRVPFVQGKFNMGGTGVLRFCGKRNLNLIISRRNPRFVSLSNEPSDRDWGFTVIRRDDPPVGLRSSVYRYLAPVNAEQNPTKGGVLHFNSLTLPIFPEDLDPYKRESEWGTAIKLYEYGASKGYSNGHIIRRDGLLSRLDLLLPNIALPIRLYEYRSNYTKGEEKRSFETTLSGLSTRLEDNKADNVEDGFPETVPITVAGLSLTATIYAFKKDKAQTYKKSEGIIFTVNGQTHAVLSSDFFRRSAVKLDYLRDSILVIVDCSKVIGRSNEELFMNSRDRLADGPLKRQIEDELESLLRQHPGLRALAQRRRQEEIQEVLENDKPLEDILKHIIKDSPTLAALFLYGTRIANPFKSEQAGQNDKPYEGKRFPTYFKLKGVTEDTELIRECPLNQRARLIFETDAEPNYFGRDTDPGKFEIHLQENDPIIEYSAVGPNIHNGSATLSIKFPANMDIGSRLHFVTQVTDSSRVEPFSAAFCIVISPTEGLQGEKSKRRTPPGDKQGKEHEVPPGISLPPIVKVYEKDWGKRGFNKYSALKVVRNASDTDSDNIQYDFYVNMNNVYLGSELKRNLVNAEVVNARFMYGLVLLGLGMLDKARRDNRDKHAGDDQEKGNIDDLIYDFTMAAAPVLLPMIEALGGLDPDSLNSSSFAGEN